MSRRSPTAGKSRYQPFQLAQVFSDRFLVMSDAERLAETRKVLDDLDRLNSQVSYIDVQAKAIKYNSEMLNTYF